MRVDRLQQTYDIDIVYRHFPLHPGTPEAGLTLEELFAGRDIDIPAAKARMTKLMADEGLPYGDRTRTYNSRLAQELAKWAESQPGGEKIHDALFRAYFVENTNFAMVDKLVSIAGQVGLSVNAARDVLIQRTCREAVDEDWSRSRELGITGVPTFVVGHRGLVGAQPYDELVQLIMAAGAIPRKQ